MLSQYKNTNMVCKYFDKEYGEMTYVHGILLDFTRGWVEMFVRNIHSQSRLNEYTTPIRMLINQNKILSLYEESAD